MSDLKYKAVGGGKFSGRIKQVQTGKHIPKDEPLFILRAQDKRALPALRFYMNSLKNAEHQKSVRLRIKDFNAWKREHPDTMKEPD